MDKIIITLTKDELRTLAHIMDHFTYYMMGDDRADHRIGILNYYREMGGEKRDKVLALAKKLMGLADFTIK
ncbi:MAG: hypothetical protein Q7J06_10620 [Bacteroidales bacterium]|nr:hypothetical protein [Bacteroidales bacterium]